MLESSRDPQQQQQLTMKIKLVKQKLIKKSLIEIEKRKQFRDEKKKKLAEDYKVLRQDQRSTTVK